MGCNKEETTTYSNCNPCTPPVDCSCPVLIKTSCVNIYDGDDLECAGIESGIPLNDVLKAMDTYVCEAIAGNISAVNLENIGVGAEIYAGISGVGKRQIRKLKSSDNSVIITEGIEDIDFTVVAGIVPDGSETKVQSGTKSNVTGSGTTLNPYIINVTVDGSETKIVDGTNTTVTGNGTTATPYAISVPTITPTDGSETKILNGNNTTVSGNGTIATPYIINVPSIDGSETKINVGAGLTIIGSGTIASPYTIKRDSLQKNITQADSPYTIVATDNNYSIIINNGANPVTIIVPTSLPSKMFVGFIQKGTGDVTFTTSGTTIDTTSGLKIKGQNYTVGLEQVSNSNIFNLLGNTKA